MASLTQAQLRSCTSGRRAAFSTSRATRVVRVSCQAQQAQGLDRRQVLLAGLVVGLTSSRAGEALATEYATFQGQDKPPTSYGGYGGQMVEDAKYVFEYPANWKSDVINKIEKGTQGIDCRVFNPRNKRQQAFVITLARAGEDNASFRLVDVDSTLAGFAGADSDLLDALADDATKTSTSREVNGQLYYDISIESAEVIYRSAITVNQGKVYAIFVKSPANLFEASKEDLLHIVETFRTT